MIEDVEIRFILNSCHVKSSDELIEKATECFGGDIEKHADIIIGVAKERKIEITDKLQAIQKLTIQAKEAALNQQNKEHVLSTLNEIDKIKTELADNIKNGVSLEHPDMRFSVEKITKLSSGLYISLRNTGKYVYEDYIRKCKSYDPNKDFKPQLFGGSLPFPNGTVSYVGARTGRGKTASMLNLAREALLLSKRAIFISLEMNIEHLITRLALSCSYDLAVLENNINRQEILEKEEKPQTRLYQFVRENNNDENTLNGLFDKSLNHISNAMRNGNLVFFDGRGRSLLEITNFIISETGKGDIVLLDYIQRLPPPDTCNNTETYMRVKATSDVILTTAMKSDAVVIAGAQFSRAGVKFGTNQKEEFDDASFRESGDLEQDAHNAIGIGKISDNGRYVKILKARDSAGEGCEYDLKWVAKYQYMSNTGKLEKEKKNVAV